MISAVVIGMALVLASAIGGLSYVIAARRSAGPTRELASAVRVLDRILAYDDAVSSLSAELRREAQAITLNYHKELP